MVASFSVIMYKRANSNRETLELINEISSVKKIIENAILSGEIDTEADEEKQIFSNYTLSYTLNGEPTSMPLTEIEKAVIKKDTNTNGLYYCTLTHSRGETVFVVYSRVGESVSIGGGA